MTRDLTGSLVGAIVLDMDNKEHKMNERIRELAQQAGAEFNDWHDHISLLDDEIEKFAQLIVQECVQLAMTQHCSTSPADYDEMAPYDQGCDDTASRISGLIRRTFGVWS